MSSAATPSSESGAAESAEQSARKELPLWVMPRPMADMSEFWSRFYPLRVRNSLTRSKVPFVTMEPGKVYAYICGPTVYDSAHMGHARAYLSFDIVRRILEDYFDYDVFWQMNITDIDDKIITRSRERGVPFLDLARQYETEFMEDMARLGVRPPTTLTRISEFIPEVVEMVSGIIAKGFGYASNGSVYFDVPAFQRHKKTTYGKLVPENVGNIRELEEGEGALSATGDKRNASDFALWKASKEGEPSWDSSWGQGRPGWHIECAAMICDVMKDMTGGKLDVHAGGIDLRFPHHDNEIAQAEAYLNEGQWVNYFLHAGHLNIDGLKMSKSLKNFVTIRSALQTHSPRVVRLLFLLGKWDTVMNFSEGGVEVASAKDRFFTNFFANTRARMRNLNPSDTAKWAAEEWSLHRTLAAARDTVHEALCDNFDTPRALEALEGVAHAVNKYTEKQGANAQLLHSCSAYVDRMFRVFGLVDPLPKPGGSTEGGGSGDRESTVAPFVDAIRDFREDVRQLARSGDVKALLPLCDRLRDDVLAELGVSLRDEDGGPASWNLVDPAVLREAREAARREQEAREAEKAARVAKKAAEEAAKAERAKIPPADYMRTLTDRYSQWDEQGIPTHAADGSELTKSAVKSAKKEFQKQEKMHAKWLKQQQQ